MNTDVLDASCLAHEHPHGSSVSATRASSDPPVNGVARSGGLREEFGATVREGRTNVGGQPVRYLTSGEGQPLVLLHALGDNALDWSWVLPTLSQNHRVYAPDLPGIGGDGRILEDPSPAFFASFVAAFLDILGVERAAIVGNSYGSLVALRLALSDPARVSALGLVGSAGLGRAISPALSVHTIPGCSEAAVVWSKTYLGTGQRTLGRAALLFARPGLAPPSGSRSSVGWLGRPVFWRRRWAPCAPRSAPAGSARCC